MLLGGDEAMAKDVAGYFHLLADIFLGKVGTWNDPAIAALNPGVTLPSGKISVVHRSDGSGTTFNFTNYLSKVSPEFKTVVGEGTTVTLWFPRLEPVEAAVREALANGTASDELILNILSRRREPATPHSIVTSEDRMLQHPPLADCARYDLLRGYDAAA